MGKYTTAAHQAARTVETQEGLLECRHPANNLVREFLLEVRRQRHQNSTLEGVDQLAGQMKRAADLLVTHPFRVHDSASAQRVKGCGATIGKIIADGLFAEYPSEPPSEEELQELAQQEAAIKAAAAAQRKRKKEAAAAAAGGGGANSGAAGGAPPPPAAARSFPAAAAGAGAAIAAAAAAAAAAGGEEDEEQPGGKRKKKAVKEYIPQLGSANYAFLICMLQAQKGPAKQQHFGKQELMELAEASGLSDKPIFGDGTAARQRPDGRSFDYDGWNGFRKQLINKGLAHEWSNPKKVSLTPQGFALAERLYRDSVARGVLQPIAGIPATGPMLFQLGAAEPGAAAAAAAGLPEGVLPSATLHAGRRLTVQQQPPPRQQQQPPPQQQQQPPAAAALRAEVPEAAPAPAARRPAAAAERPAAADHALDELEYYSLPLTERLQRQQPSQQYYQQQQQVAGAARPAAGASGRTAAATAAAAADVINLLSDGDSPSPLQKRGAAAAAARAAAVAAAVEHAAPAPAHRAAAAAAAAAAVPDAQLAAMVGMGYSDKKARRALRQSSGETGLPGIGRAVELAEELDSDVPGSSSDEEDLLPGRLPPLLPSGARGAAAAVRGAGAGGSLAPGLQPQRGWEQQQAAAAERREEAGRPLLGANPAIFAGGAAGARTAAAAAGAAAAARHAGQLPATRPAAAAALERQDSRRSQQQGRGGGGGTAAVAVGHIRMGSQQQQLEAEDEEQQQQQKEGAAAAAGHFDLDRFFSQIDRQLEGGGSGSGGDGSSGGGRVVAAAGPAAAGAAVTRSGSGIGRAASGSGSIRLQRQDVRLPPLPAGRRFGEEYQVLMLVDGREQYRRQAGQGRGSALDVHIAAMRAAGLVVEERQLPIGDTVWIARSRRQPSVEYVLDYVLERKSIDDLVSSVKGKENRYERQKYYLKRCGLRQVYYLIEGDPDMLPGEIEQKMARTAAAKTEVLDGFIVLRTTDHRSTFRLYQRITQHIQEWYQHMTAAENAAAAGEPPTFAAWQAQCKENADGTTTLHDLWGMMLGAVPTLGPDAVQAILRHYPTPLHLYKAYQEAAALATRSGGDGHRAAERLLHGLKAVSGTKTIGPDKASKVYNCLFKRRVAHGMG